APRRSGDDGGFSVLLTRPVEPYLVGRQEIAIEPTLPAGDRIAQVDFFVDGRLVDTDREAPYGSTYDFGETILRHTIVVTALTTGERRAKVSFVSRAALLDRDPARPIAIVPAVVRDATGRLLEGLSVSDFTLLENGAPQTILHFDHEPVPWSVAVVLHAPAAAPQTRGALLRQAASLAEWLPVYHALTFVEGSGRALLTPSRARTVPATAVAEGPAVGRAAGRGLPEPVVPTPGFGFDRQGFYRHLSGSVEEPVATGRKGGPTLADSLSAAARGLATRPRGRALLLLVAGYPAEDCPVPEPAPIVAQAGLGGPPPPPATPLGGAPAPRAKQEAAPPDVLDEAIGAALEDLRRADGLVNVIVLGEARGPLLQLLQDQAESTGGEFIVARSEAGLEAATRTIAETLTGHYMVSYAPPHPERPGWRKLEVRVRRPDATVRVRGSQYVEPPPSGSGGA
ncbi:MAG: hypothetical protein ACRD5D_05125, partial [Candidatus Polarisedimenticolia bacterium]